LPGSFTLFVSVWPLKVEEELVGVGFIHEVGPISELFNLVEFSFHEAMNCLNIGLHPVRSGEYGSMLLVGNRFYRSGIGRRGFGVPGADEFRAVICL
jgi:hypothetical protein